MWFANRKRYIPREENFMVGMVDLKNTHTHMMYAHDKNVFATLDESWLM